MLVKRSLVILLAASVIMTTVLLVRSVPWNLPGINQGYAPEQPIRFSHRLHSGDLQMDCQYCHTAAEESRRAAVPNAMVCMNCHRFVTAPWDDIKQEEKRAEEANRDARLIVSQEIKKLYDVVGFNSESMEYNRSEKTGRLEWIRVHDLPDYVYFNHSGHVNAGVTCRRCHGPVETMDRVYQYADLTMGWCVNCHRDVNKGRITELKERQASISCTVCHY